MSVMSLFSVFSALSLLSCIVVHCLTLSYSVLHCLVLSCIVQPAFRACALRTLGLLLADGVPTVGLGKTFWRKTGKTGQKRA